MLQIKVSPFFRHPLVTCPSREYFEVSIYLMYLGLAVCKQAVVAVSGPGQAREVLERAEGQLSKEEGLLVLSVVSLFECCHYSCLNSFQLLTESWTYSSFSLQWSVGCLGWGYQRQEEPSSCLRHCRNVSLSYAPCLSESL